MDRNQFTSIGIQYFSRSLLAKDVGLKLHSPEWHHKCGISNSLVMQRDVVEAVLVEGIKRDREFSSSEFELN